MLIRVYPDFNHLAKPPREVDEERSRAKNSE